MNWQPIKSAPKNGTPVLLWSVYPHPAIPPICITGKYIKGLREWVGLNSDIRLHPTHWMPLPEPPTGDER